MRMTKKLFALLTLLLCFGWQLAWAEYYGFSIVGIDITSENYADLKTTLGEHLKKGNVTYDPATKTLTLEDAEIDSPQEVEYAVHASDLTITLSGKSKITKGNKEAVMRLSRSIINGTGELTIDNITVSYESSLTVKDVTLNVTSLSRSPVPDWRPHRTDLHLEEATVYFNSIGGLTIDWRYANGYYLAQGYFWFPNWTYDNPQLDDSQGQNLICPKNGQLGLLLAGEIVTEENYKDLKTLLGDKLKKGTLTYDPDTKTLTLEGVEIEVKKNKYGTLEIGLYSQIEGFSLVLKGYNTINSAVSGNVVVTGAGVLDVKSFYASLVKDAQVITTGSRYQPKVDHLEMSNAILISSSGGYVRYSGGYARYKGSFFTNSYESCNKGCDYWSVEKCDPLVIAPSPLSVAGCSITKENAGDLKKLLGDKLKRGSVTYDPEARVLTLDGAEIDATEAFCGLGIYRGYIAESFHGKNVKLKTLPLSIVLKGENKITSHGTAMNIFESTTISGGGTLVLVSERGEGIRLGRDLKIQGGKVDITGEITGVEYQVEIGVDKNAGTLVLEDTELIASGIKQLESLVCVRETLLEPEEGKIKDNGIELEGAKSLHLVPHKVYYTLFFGSDPMMRRSFEITNYNYQKLASYLFGYNANGSITYDPETRLLTFDRVKLPELVLIDNEEPTTISMKGDCVFHTLRSSEKTKLEVTAGAHIKVADLNIAAQQQCTLKDCALELNDGGIHVGKGATLTLENCEVDINTPNRGIAGVKGVDGEKLVVKNSSIRIRSSEGAICDFDEVEFLPSADAYEIKGGTIGKHGIMDGANVSTGTVAVLVKGRITLSPTTLTFDYKQGEQEVTLTSDGEWLASCAETWVTLSKAAGSGNATFKVSVSENTTGQAREAQLVITSKANPEVKKVITISQKLRFVHLQSITLKPATLFIVEGKKGRVAKIIFEPENASNKQVKWESKDTDIATVDPVSGEITAIAKGECLICAWSQENTTVGGGCQVKVISESEVIHVATITVKPAELSLTVGKTASLTATITPVDAMDQRIEWRSSADAVASVKEENGVVTVTALAPGSCTITARSLEEGSTVKGTCLVTVKAPQQDKPQHPTQPSTTAVEDSARAFFSVSPNPFTNQLRIANPDGVVACYEVVTLAGEVARSGILEGSETFVDTSTLSPALYLLRITTSDGAFFLKHVVKQ